ncbi:GntR family transcriptional regulator [Roseateles chitinivorans]|uniref:GntR family transcriptional regulator n=1 Tax=Roseateles chitinivorans TaxID=2917965 RepID=UPI003D670A2F
MSLVPVGACDAGGPAASVDGSHLRFIPLFCSLSPPAGSARGRLLWCATSATHWRSGAPRHAQLERSSADLSAARRPPGVAAARRRPPEGEALPSVRTLASQYLINPLTVSRALQALVDEGLVESRRGVGMYVRDGARIRLLHTEREQFLQEEWPRLREKLRRLGLKPQDLNWEDA